MKDLAMFDDNLTGKIIASTMRCAERQAWHKITMEEIADEAGITSAELGKHFSSKIEILTAFTRHIDEALADKKSALDKPDESPRDRLFEVIMTRLELMAPYRLAIRNIVYDRQSRLSLLTNGARPFLFSQYKMLKIASISAARALGALRLSGLALVYASVFNTWMNDDEPGFERTMAALDRRLRCGESMFMRLDQCCQACCCVIRGLTPEKTGCKPEEEAEKAPSSPDPAPAAGP